MANGGDISGQMDAAAQRLRGGDAAGAKAILDALTAAFSDTTHLPAQLHWTLAQACRRLDDSDGEIAALHRLLALDTRHLGALLAMGDAFDRRGDLRAAESWFRLALRQASVAPPAPALMPLLQQAQTRSAQAQERFAEHLQAEIKAAGDAMRGSAALDHALAMLTGKADLFLQQPTMFYYPGLPQRCFFEREAFAWVPQFEAQADMMRDELLNLTGERNAFAPYVERSQSRPAPNNPLLEDDSWGAAYLWRSGEVTSQGHAAPHTMAALQAVDMPVIRARSPMALYSRLRPGTHIAPHHGLLNTRLICHLPLVAPDGCALRVGHETRAWRYGELLIFDDSIEHEAWNRGVSDRTILLFEIWRPEIPEHDRIALANLFEAIDRLDPTLGQEQV